MIGCFIVFQAASKPEGNANANTNEHHNRIGRLKKTFQHLIKVIGNSQNLADILNRKDSKGYTPLTLSARNSSKDMFELIINCSGVYKLLNDVDSVSHSYIYDVTEVDSAIDNGDKSVMNIIMSKSHESPSDYFEFTELCPILNLIKMKWTKYQYFYFGWGALHLLLMCLYTAATVLSAGQFKTTIDITTTIYAILLTIQELYQTIRQRSFQLTNPMGDGPYRLLLMLFGFTTLLTLILQVVSTIGSEMARSFSLIFGWVFTMFFTRGIKSFSYFTVMMQMALGDLFRFTIVYLIILVPFSTAMMILYKHNPSNPSEQFTDIWASIFTMFQLTMGLVELDSLGLAYYSELATIFYIAFLATAYVLLLNMVIALLSETCARVSSNKQSQWHLQKLGIVLYIERRLPARYRRVCGNSEQVRLFQPEKENPDTPREINQYYHGGQKQQNTTKRFYLEVKTLTQRSVEEYKTSSKQSSESQIEHELPDLSRSHQAPLFEQEMMEQKDKALRQTFGLCTATQDLPEMSINNNTTQHNNNTNNNINNNINNNTTHHNNNINNNTNNNINNNTTQHNNNTDNANGVRTVRFDAPKSLRVKKKKITGN